MEETSLEDFLDGGTTDERADAATSGQGATEAAHDGTPDESADSPTVTAAWSPDGARCAACGERVAWRWGAEADLVCRDCKDW